MARFPCLVTKSRYHIAKSQQAAVDAEYGWLSVILILSKLAFQPDSLLGPVSRCPRPLEPLRSGKVDKVELGRQGLVVVVVGRLVDVVKPLRVRTKRVLGPALPLLLHVQGEDGVRPRRLVVHVCRRSCPAVKVNED